MPRFNKHTDQPPSIVPPARNGNRVPTTAEGFRSLAEAYRARSRDRGHLDQSTHLALIAWTITGTDEAAASERIIAAFRRLDRRRAAPLAPGRGYNETITIFWITVASRRLPRAATETERVAAARAFVRAYEDRGELVYEYFSRSLVHSWRARARWVEPDLRPIGALLDHAHRRA